HALPDLETVHAFAERQHFPARFEPGNEGARGRVGVETLARQHVREIHSRGFDGKQDFARARDRIRDILEAKDLGRTGTAKEDGTHGRVAHVRSAGRAESSPRRPLWFARFAIGRPAPRRARGSRRGSAGPLRATSWTDPP